MPFSFRWAAPLLVLSANIASAGLIAGTSLTEPLPFDPRTTFALIYTRDDGASIAQMGPMFTLPSGSWILTGFTVPLRSTEAATASFSLYNQSGNSPGQLLANTLPVLIPGGRTYQLYTFTFLFPVSLTGGTYYLIGSSNSSQLEWAGAPDGTFGTFAYRVTPPGGWNRLANVPLVPAYQVLGFGSSTNDIPEPSTWALAGVGAVFLAFARGGRSSRR